MCRRDRCSGSREPQSGQPRPTARLWPGVMRQERRMPRPAMPHPERGSAAHGIAGSAVAHVRIVVASSWNLWLRRICTAVTCLSSGCGQEFNLRDEISVRDEMDRLDEFVGERHPRFQVIRSAGPDQNEDGDAVDVGHERREGMFTSTYFPPRPRMRPVTWMSEPPVPGSITARAGHHRASSRRWRPWSAHGVTKIGEELRRSRSQHESDRRDRGSTPRRPSRSRCPGPAPAEAGRTGSCPHLGPRHWRSAGHPGPHPGNHLRDATSRLCGSRYRPASHTRRAVKADYKGSLASKDRA